MFWRRIFFFFWVKFTWCPMSFMNLDIQISPEIWKFLSHYLFKKAFRLYLFLLRLHNSQNVSFVGIYRSHSHSSTLFIFALLWVYIFNLLSSNSQKISSAWSVYLFSNLSIYLWLHWVFTAARGLVSSCGERGLLFVAVRGLLIVVASLAVEHRL